MEKKVTLELTVNQLNAVILALTKVSIEVGLDAYGSITQQAEAQLGMPNKSGPLSDKVIN